MSVLPATVTVPVRLDELGFAAALKVTFPPPVPLAVVRVNHGAGVEADQLHASGVVIAAVLPDEADDPRDKLVGASV